MPRNASNYMHATSNKRHKVSHQLPSKLDDYFWQQIQRMKVIKVLLTIILEEASTAELIVPQKTNANPKVANSWFMVNNWIDKENDVLAKLRMRLITCISLDK